MTPAERRSGTITPCAPKASAERITAPRLRGSVTPSSATSSGGGRRLVRGGEHVGQLAVAERRHLQRDALVQQAAGRAVELGPADLEQRDAAVAGEPHRLGDPLVGLDADATYSAVAGIFARSASATGLRPTSSSGAVASRAAGRGSPRVARGGRGPARRRVPLAVLGGRGRPLALQRRAGAGRPSRRWRPSWTCGPRPAGGSCRPLRHPAIMDLDREAEVRFTRLPSWPSMRRGSSAARRVSSTTTPAAASWSRIASAAA